MFPKYEKPFYFHFQKVEGKRGMTVCAIPDGESNVNVGIAICNPKDNYNKRAGRKIAMTRAKSVPVKFKVHDFDELKDKVADLVTCKMKTLSPM